MDKTEIFRIYGKDYKANTIELLERVGLSEMIDKDARIGIKPNLVDAVPACMGSTTHPEIVEGLIEYLQASGHRDITIMEGSWVGGNTLESYDVCGFDLIKDKYGVKLVDTQKSPSHPVDCSGTVLNICDCVDDIDFLINIPVIKGHAQTHITCALKNMKGLIPNSEKRRFHSLGLHDPIARLCTGIKQDFILIDHICGDLEFEDGGNPTQTDCILAALDPVLVDAYVCQLLGYEIEEVPYVKLAGELGVGCLDVSQIKMITIGEVPAGVEDLYKSGRLVGIADNVNEVEGCSACYAAVLPALERLREEGLLDRLDEKISLGQFYKNKTGKLGVGTCTRLFDVSVPGCPPKSEDIYIHLRKYLLEK